MKVKNKAYMAGVIDAEGCLYIGKQEEHRTKGSYNYSVVISVTNNCERLMKWIVYNFGGTYIKASGKSFRWLATNQKHISSFLDLIYPYLNVKKSQASVLYEYISLNGAHDPKRRENLYLKCKAIKSQECVTTNSSGIFLPLKILRPYVAGLFDGEGSVIIGKQRASKYYTRISLEQSFYPSLCLLQAMFGGKLAVGNKVNLQCYKWSIDRSENKEKFLLQMLPYLIVKREKAKLLLEYLRLGRKECPNIREVYFQRSEKMKIESDLIGDYECAPVVTQAA
jgi:LAGLIDADG endonuclease